MFTADNSGSIDNVVLDIIRLDITNPDKAEARIEFYRTSDGDLELNLRWGDPEKSRGSFLLLSHNVRELRAYLET